MNRDHDRDRLLEDALTHELRAAALPPAGDACLDAETVAAWIDEGLDAHGMAMAEAHASTCARCQALLGSLARSTPVVTVAESAGARLWRWWFAPLAATAAAVTVWMVVPQDQLTAPPSPVAVESVAPQEAARSEPLVAVTQAAPPVAAETKKRDNVGRDRNDAPAQRAEVVAPKPEAQAFGARERSAETAKLADTAAEGRAAAMAPPPPAPAPLPAAAAPPAAPAIALRKQIDPVADATARSSPSANVIWLVARGGMVHLATDGRTFVRLSFPEAVDLTAVTASDERRAVVTTADGRTFQTADGGRTWQRP